MKDDLIVDGIVLAAGASSRMGKSKALLEVEGKTFLEHAVHVLREAGCRYVIAVIGDDDWTARIADVSGAAIVKNEAVDSEQIDSLRLGIANLPDDCAAVMVLPVDFPRVQSDTARRLIEEFRGSRAPLVNPARKGVAGHPVIISRALFAELLTPNLPAGARSVMAAHAAETRIVEVTDEGVVIDVDTPADYEQHVSDRADQ